MRLSLFIVILPFLCWAFDAKAQVTEELSSMPEQWQVTLDEIKSKTQSLGLENDGLKAEYRQLIQQVQELQQSIDDQQAKNQQMDDFLKARHGRTDQQLRIDELTQAIRTKKQEARSYEEQFENLQRKQMDLDNKIRPLKNTVSNEEFRQQAQIQQAAVSRSVLKSKDKDQLVQLRKQLEDESTQEVLLENQLGSLKTGGTARNLDQGALETENKQLEARLDMLRSQKLQHTSLSSDEQLSQASARMYDKLKSHKGQLEAKIYAYESRMDELRQSSLTALSWPLKKKKLVHDMVEMDARNNKMREAIKVLREDIDILKDQVARLERRLDFAKGK